MSFLDGKVRVADKETCQFNWLGKEGGEYFRCAFCGHRFQPGDKWRLLYTNNVPEAPGNPLVCESCDAPNEELVTRWKAMCKEWDEMHEINGRWWWFAR